LPTLIELLKNKLMFDKVVADHGGFGAKEKPKPVQGMQAQTEYDEQVMEVRSGYRGAVRAQYVRRAPKPEPVTNNSMQVTYSNFPTLSAIAEEYQKGYKAGYVDGVSAESARAKKQKESNKQKVDVIKKERDVSFED